MYYNSEKGFISGVKFAIIGFFLSSFHLLFVHSSGHGFLSYLSFPSFPGFLILLGLFGSGYVVGFLYVAAGNSVAYGIAGYVIGALSKTRRQFAYLTGLFAIVVLLGSCCYLYLPARIKQVRLASQLKGQTARLEADPNDVNALYWMGNYHWRRGEVQEAERYFRRVVGSETSGGDSRVKVQRSLILLAVFCQSRGEYQEAEDCYQRFIASGPRLSDDAILSTYSDDYLKKKRNRSQTEGR